MEWGRGRGQRLSNLGQILGKLLALGAFQPKKTPSMEQPELPQPLPPKISFLSSFHLWEKKPTPCS